MTKRSPKAVPSKVDRIVVLMLENRSFDHMLGLFPNRRMKGLLGANGTSIDPRFSNIVTRKSGKESVFPERMGADYTVPTEQIDRQGFGGPSHSFPAATMQLYGATAPANFPKPAPMSGFAQSYYKQLQMDAHIANPTDDQIAVPMTAFEHGQLPVMWQLAQEFCVCDQWFSEVPGPTQPNRLFVHAGTSEGFTHNVWSRKFTSRTIYQELENAGRDWSVFYFDLRDSDSFPDIKKRIDRVLQFDNFFAQAKAGTLPSYSFLCPRYNDPKKPSDPPPNSEHAPYDVRNGENLIADVYEALRNGPLWDKTLLIVTYDEHGGYFDHLPPPDSNIANPDGLVSPTADDKQQAKKNPKRNNYLLKPDYQFAFNRLGVRVPALLVSPWVSRGSVYSEVLQHTSIFATLRELFGVGSLTKRDKQAAGFAAALDLKAARPDSPTILNRPPLTPTLSVVSMIAPLTHQQAEMWPLLSQLDGDKDSGKVTAPPATRAEAAAYIERRLAAHEAFHRERRRKACYKISKLKPGAFTWKFHDDRGKVIAVSPKTYRSVQEAEDDIESLRDLAAFARLAH